LERVLDNLHVARTHAERGQRRRGRGEEMTGVCRPTDRGPPPRRGYRSVVCEREDEDLSDVAHRHGLNDMPLRWWERGGVEPPTFRFRSARSPRSEREKVPLVRSTCDSHASSETRGEMERPIPESRSPFVPVRDCLGARTIRGPKGCACVVGDRQQGDVQDSGRHAHDG
jgi:hypothetical protein